MKPSVKISKNKMNSAPPVRLSVFICILRNLVEYLIRIGQLERAVISEEQRATYVQHMYTWTVAMETVDP